MRIALAQINTTVGDIAGNERLIAAQIEAARERGAAVVLVPELAITGYPPEDLLLKEHFLADARAAIERLAAETQGIVAVVGFPERAADHVYNSAAILRDGAIAQRLPQGPSAQLRRLRRAPLLRLRPARRRP